VLATVEMDPIVFSLFWNKAVKLAAKQGWMVKFVKGNEFPFAVFSQGRFIREFKSVTDLSSYLTQTHWSLGNQSFIADGW
jgi:hypothetical protein